MIATEIENIGSSFDVFPRVPKHWQLIRIKNLFKEIDRRSESGNEDLLSVSQYTGVTLRKDAFEDGKEITNAKTLKGYKTVEQGDLVVNIMLAWNGCLGISPYFGITSPAYCVYRVKNLSILNPEYFGYLFSTTLFKCEFRKRSTGIIESRLRLYSDAFFRIFCFVPPKDEQDRIVNLINTESTRITHFIQTKQRFIELLKEQRQSIITNAVTKGIDDGVKMKKTVLGEIPEHWEVRRLKFMADVNFSTIDKHSHKEEKQVRLCNYVDVYKHEYITNDFDFMIATATDAEIKRFSVEKGDVIITKDSETADDIAIPALVVEDLENVVCAYHLAHIKPSRELVESEFLFRLFQSKKINSHFEVAAKGVTRHGLSYDDINSVFLPYPPTLNEQQEIIKHIKTETRTLDIAISKAERETELIKEYREAVIAEAVTGKMKF
jgi:type I restriction enzyme, S subunit